MVMVVLHHAKSFRLKWPCWLESKKTHKYLNLRNIQAWIVSPNCYGWCPFTNAAARDATGALLNVDGFYSSLWKYRDSSCCCFLNKQTQCSAFNGFSLVILPIHQHYVDKNWSKTLPFIEGKIFTMCMSIAPFNVTLFIIRLLRAFSKSQLRLRAPGCSPSACVSHCTESAI